MGRILISLTPKGKGPPPESLPTPAHMISDGDAESPPRDAAKAARRKPLPVLYYF